MACDFTSPSTCLAPSVSPQPLNLCSPPPHLLIMGLPSLPDCNHVPIFLQLPLHRSHCNVLPLLRHPSDSSYPQLQSVLPMTAAPGTSVSCVTDIRLNRKLHHALSFSVLSIANDNPVLTNFPATPLIHYESSCFLGLQIALSLPSVWFPHQTLAL